MIEWFCRVWDTYWHPDNNPIPNGPARFDPLLGESNREERVMLATEEDLRACKVPKKDWDFCAHKLLELERCRADNFPFLWRCKAESHDTSMCYLDDYILRMKEYERERRLIQRELRLKEREISNNS